MRALVYAAPRRERAAVVRLGSLLPLVGHDAPKAWVHLTIDGEYAGHADGAFKFDHKTNQMIVANFKASKNPIQLTYEHPRYDDGQAKPAAGWVHALKEHGGGLWGYVEFTAKSAAMIKAGEYRFTSVVVLFKSTDRKTGKPIGPEMLEVALTNSPFIDGQTPIALSRRRTAALKLGAKMDLDLDLLLKALKDGFAELPAKPEAAQIQELLQAELLRQQALHKSEDLEAPADAPPPPPPDEAALSVDAPASVAAAAGDAVSPEASLATDALAALVEITGLDAAAAVAFVKDNAAAIASLAGKQDPSGTDSAGGSAAEPALSRSLTRAATARIEALQKEVALSRAAVAERDAKIADLGRKAIESEVDAMILDGKLTDGERAFAIELKSTQPELVSKWYAARSAPNVPTGRIASRARPTAAHDLSQHDTSERAERLRANMRTASPHASDELIEKRVAAALAATTNGTISGR